MAKRVAEVSQSSLTLRLPAGQILAITGNYRTNQVKIAKNLWKSRFFD
jgi:hypothetical protein